MRITPGVAAVNRVIDESFGDPALSKMRPPIRLSAARDRSQ